MTTNFFPRLFIIGMTILIAAGFVIYRRGRMAAGKYSLSRLIEKLKNGSVTPEQVARELDVPYHTLMNISEPGFSMLTEKIKEGIVFGNYRILYAIAVDAHNFLVLTELSFTDFDIGFTGEAGDVKSKAYHNFQLKFNPSKLEVTIWSTLYHNNTEKFQKQEFLKRV